MTSITTRSGKGEPLTHDEVDDNFTNLNADKLEASSNLSDVANAATARTNLGLGTAATTASTDYATAAQGTLADSAVQPNDSPTFGTVTVTGTVDGRDVAADGSKLDGIEAGANVTDTANVTAAGALMDSEVTNLAQVKAFDSSDYATAAQGSLADSALQSGDNVSALTNDAGYTTNVGDITGVTAGTGLTGGGTSGTVTLNGVTQSEATWEAGTGTTESLVTPAKVKAAIDALAGGGGGVPTGAVIYVAQNTAPTDFLKANGAAVSRTTYADLFAAIGTTFGSGDGSTTFNLPDLRGEFIRAWDDARGIDSGRSFGSAQGDAIRNITGEAGYIRVKLNNTHYSSGAFTSALDVLSGDANAGSAYTARYTFNASNVVPTANENRPRNIALLACIKY